MNQTQQPRILGFDVASGWCVVWREVVIARLVSSCRQKPTSGKGPKNPVLPHRQQLLLLSVSNQVNTTGQRNSLISSTHNPFIFVILQAHTTKQPRPPPTTKSCKDFCLLPKTPRENPSAMSDGPPQLGEIPQQSEISVPVLKSNMESNGPSAGNGSHSDSNTSIQNAKDSIYNSEVSSWPS